MNRLSQSFLRIRIIYAVTTLLLVALSVYVFIQIKNLIDAAQSMSSANKITQTLQNIATNIVQAESSSRGFLLTKDSIHLLKVEIALNKLQTQRVELRELISKKTGEIHNFSAIDSAIDNKIAHLLPSSFSIILPENSIYSQKALKDSIEEIDVLYKSLHLLKEKDSSTLANNTNEYNHQSILTPTFMIVFFLGGILVLWASYLKIIYTLKEEHILKNKLLLQKIEIEKRAGELLVINDNLLKESNENKTNSDNLFTANKEIAFELVEKEKRAEELIIINQNLQQESNENKSNSDGLLIANKEIAHELEEKEKRALELIQLNKELELFAQIASHDLQEPLRKIQMFSSRIKEKELSTFSLAAKDDFEVIEDAAARMQVLIDDLIAYAQTNNDERTFEDIDLQEIIKEVIDSLSEPINAKGIAIEVGEMCNAYIIPFQFRQLMTNLISNSIKFSQKDKPNKITISSCIEKGDSNIHQKLEIKKNYCHIIYEDTGIGFNAKYNEKIFEVFQRLHGKETYKGTGIGLAIVKRIVENHKGIITAKGKPNEGAMFDIYLPTN